ncbi:hypothetical protein LS73_002550 [Helicobacter muridarum]|uniref:Ancestral polypeptide n=1 Tax=Helicobacter muridarum TaxID=216 RepID=A0A099U0H4_9HELI|nr:hypothetical protein [Helicobacter muridarum]TLE01169.1 hypothetical protein LS73_002550 [Helicobacter muridarum]STQ86044.1 ancestral polypeptide [Helicobacter muridarum]
MPLPLIPVLLGGAAVATALFGAKKGYDAYEDTKTANRWHEKAKDLYDEAESELNAAINKAQDSFKTLGELQADIVENELTHYAELIDKFDVENNVDLARVVGKDTMYKLAEVRQFIISLETTLGAAAGSAAAGALAGFGAFGGAGLLACASTGTAISTLSGVAATNATLAWFGGGSLAAGGLGMAGGTLVLGGIVVAPVIAVAASVFAASAEKKKYDAYAYYDSVKALCEAMNGEALMHKEILAKSIEKIGVLETNRQEMQELLTDVDGIMQDKGTSISAWRKIEQRALKNLMQFAEVVVKTINAPIMNDEDTLTRQLREHQEKCKELMNEIQRKWG